MACRIAMNVYGFAIYKATINITDLTAPTMCQEHRDFYMCDYSLRKNS